MQEDDLVKDRKELSHNDFNEGNSRIIRDTILASRLLAKHV